MSEEKPARMSYGDVEFYFDGKPDLKLLIKSYKSNMLAVSKCVEELEGRLFDMADVIKYVGKVRAEK